MNKLVNKSLLAGDKFISESISNNLDLLRVVADRLLQTKKEDKISKKQEIHDTFIKINEIKLAFNMTWLMEILKMYL